MFSFLSWYLTSCVCHTSMIRSQCVRDKLHYTDCSSHHHMTLKWNFISGKNMYNRCKCLMFIINPLWADWVLLVFACVVMVLLCHLVAESKKAHYYSIMNTVTYPEECSHQCKTSAFCRLVCYLDYYFIKVTGVFGVLAVVCVADRLSWHPRVCDFKRRS